MRLRLGGKGAAQSGPNWLHAPSLLSRLLPAIDPFYLCTPLHCATHACGDCWAPSMLGWASWQASWAGQFETSFRHPAWYMGHRIAGELARLSQAGKWLS